MRDIKGESCKTGRGVGGGGWVADGWIYRWVLHKLKTCSITDFNIYCICAFWKTYHLCTCDKGAGMEYLK
jgi:hypothetical protein